MKLHFEDNLDYQIAAIEAVADLVAKQIFRQNPGMGRSVSYDIIWADT